MISTIHTDGVKFGLWVAPIQSSPSAAQGGGSCAGIDDVWSRNGWLIPGTNYIDFSIPAARDYYIAQLTRLFRMGVDMAKEDRGEEFRLETAQLAGGIRRQPGEADGEAGQPTPVSVYLPAGHWVNLFSGQVASGGQTVADNVGLNEFPLYMRAGTMIGFNARTPGVWAHGWGTSDLSQPGLAGWTFIPGPFGGVTVKITSPGRAATVSLAPG